MMVIDASIALSWCFEDESSPEADAIAHRVISEGGLVPAIFHLELTNVLLQAEKKGRLSVKETAERLDLIAAMPLQIDARTSAKAFGETLHLARANRLTTYDAAYLELALRTGAGLATKDKALSGAARNLGVTVYPL